MSEDSKPARGWSLSGLSVCVLLLVAGLAQAQNHSRSGYYVALGPAFTASSEWGDAHRPGYALEFGLVRPVSSSWQFVAALGFNGFEGDEDRFSFFLRDDSNAGPTLTGVEAGGNRVITLKGGFTRDLTSGARVTPYAGALLGISAALQGKSTALETLPQSGTSETNRVLLQDSNNQAGIGLSALLGFSTPLGRSNALFVETGYTFVFTPDDSFDDNPSFFPIKIGITFGG